MAYDTPFRQLEPKIVRYLSLPENTKAKELFIDSLAAIQLLLGRFASPPVFYQINNLDFVEDLLIKNLTQLEEIIENEGLRNSVLYDLKINIETALKLFREYLSPNKITNENVLYSLANNYVNNLVEQYVIFRQLNIQPIEETKTFKVGGNSNK